MVKAIFLTLLINTITHHYLHILSSTLFSVSFSSLMLVIGINAFFGNKPKIVEIRVRNLPVMKWVMIVEDKVFVYNTNVVTLQVKGSPIAIFCPQIIDNLVYLPMPATRKLSDNIIEVVFQPTNNYSALLDFPACVKYYEPIYTSPTVPRNYIVAEKVIVDKDGKRKRIKIEFNKPVTNQQFIIPPEILKLLQLPQLTQLPINQLPNQPTQLPTNLSLSNWDPNVWVGKEIHGYKVESVIGTGGNGYVLKVSLGGTKYAMKVLTITPTRSGTVTFQAKSGFDQLFSESENLKRLSQNPNFVTIYGIYVDTNMIREALKGNVEAYFKNPPSIVMEFMEGGSADKLLTNQNVTYSSYWPLIVKIIIKQLAQALSYLHSQGYVHLDIKPQNIFLKKDPGKFGEEVYRNINGIVKLGDLGSAVRIGGKVEQVTPAYAPPEQIEAIVTGKGADPKMDIFALGMTTYVMLTLIHDNPASDYLDKALERYINGDVGGALSLINQAKQALLSWKPTLPSTTPQDLQQVVIRSLNLDPKLRPTAQEIVNMLL